MQLTRTLALALAILALSIGAAAAQSLSPMHNSGPTPSDVKGFKLLVGNPYSKPMVFEIIPMDPKFTTLAADSVAKPNIVKLGPGISRQVIVAFKIEPGQEERTIGVCVQPKQIEGSIMPRVCGTYTGIMLKPAGG